MMNDITRDQFCTNNFFHQHLFSYVTSRRIWTGVLGESEGTRNVCKDQNNNDWDFFMHLHHHDHHDLYTAKFLMLGKNSHNLGGARGKPKQDTNLLFHI